MTMKSKEDIEKIEQDKEEGVENDESYFLPFEEFSEVPENLVK